VKPRSEWDLEEETDVVVIGSGMAGICAAIQASRLGCSTILLEKDEVLGGNSSPNLGIHISGAHSFHPYAAETGIINEIEEPAAYQGAKTHSHKYHYSITRQWDIILGIMMSESGVRVLRRNYAKGVICVGKRISEVIAEDTAVYRTRRIRVKVAVIDASGDGQIAFSAGADFRMGREARSEFGERGAPEKADCLTMGTSVTALVRKADRPIDFVPPPGTPPFEVGYGYGKAKVSKDCLYSHSSWDHRSDLCFLWHTETGGNQNTIEDDHEIHERLAFQLYSVWNHIKNEAHQEESRNWELLWVSPKAGKRESRRFLGDYVLTQTDVEKAISFPDGVAYGGYAVDVHDPVGAQARVVFHSIPPLYSIPYRCLYSRNVDNLFLAGRLVSVSHMALGTVRLQKTLATAGQAAGAAAFLCRGYGCTPREVFDRHLDELRQLLLREDATILGLPNEDPLDLAREADASASSEELFECTELEGFDRLDRFRAVMLWDWPRELRTFEAYLKNDAGGARELELRVGFYRMKRRWRENKAAQRPGHIRGPGNRMEWGFDNLRERFVCLATTKAMVQPGEGWVSFHFKPELKLPPKDPTTDEERMVLVIPPKRGISWGKRLRCADFAVSCSAGRHDPSYRTVPELHMLRLDPRPAYGEAGNVVNGYNRRFSTNPVNMWISKVGSPMPQSLILAFRKPEQISEIRLTFDTIYRSYLEMPFNDEEKKVSGMCVKDYRLLGLSRGRWRKIVSVKGNYRRFRVHRFRPILVSKLKLVVESTNEDGWPARLYEIRAYGPAEEVPGTSGSRTAAG
jgi:hypothetical protein